MHTLAREAALSKLILLPVWAGMGVFYKKTLLSIKIFLLWSKHLSHAPPLTGKQVDVNKVVYLDEKDKKPIMCNIAVGNFLLWLKSYTFSRHISVLKSTYMVYKPLFMRKKHIFWLFGISLTLIQSMYLIDICCLPTPAQQLSGYRIRITCVAL